MSTQLEPVHSDSTTELMKSLKVGVILREQESKEAPIALIAHYLQRLARLYQIPNWREENSVALAEWTYDNYQFEAIDTVIETLKNPPASEDKTFRLTPDVIQGWMATAIEKVAIEREAIHKSKKSFSLKDEFSTITDEQWKKLQVMVMDSKIKAVPQLTEQEIKEEGKDRPKPKLYPHNNYPKEYIEMKSAISSAGSYFYKDNHSFSNLSIHVVDQYEVFAASQEDAQNIFDEALKNVGNKK